MSAGLRRDAQRNRELILAAAREVFAEHGLSGSLEEIARRAGVSVGTIYHRFGNRVALIDAALADRVEESVRAAEAALADPDPWRALVDRLTAIGEMQVGDRGFTEVCALALPPDSAVERLKTRGHQLFVALVDRARAAGALRPDVSAADVGLLTWSVVDGTDGIREVAPDAWRRHLAVLLDGLRADAAHPLPGAPLDPVEVRTAMRFEASRPRSN